MAIASRRTLSLVTRAFALAGSGTLVLFGPVASAATPPPFGTSWVVDHGNDSVTEYAPTANGNVAPVATIKGVSTGLANPQSVVTDSAGDVFVTNFAANSITEYAGGASGNVSPTATISGTSTGLNGPFGLSIDNQGNLWVSDSNSNTLEEFGAGETGNVLPYASIYGSKTKLDNPTGISARDGLWVVNDPEGGTPSIENFSTYGESTGNIDPSQRLAGSKTELDDPQTVAVDLEGDPWVTNRGSNSLTHYSFGTGGDQKPTTTIAGSRTGLDQPTGLDIDAIGSLVVSNLGAGSVAVFAPTASGNAAPLRSITGAATGIDAATGVTVLATAPGVVGHLSVVPGNHSAKVSWRVPADTGGGVLGYDVVVEKHQPLGGFLVATSGPYNTAKTTLTEHHLANGHHYYFSVIAVNARGLGKAAPFASATPASPPDAVRAFKATAHTDALALTWKAPKSDGGHKITSYRLQYATCTIGSKGCAVPTLKISGKDLKYTLKDLAADHRYNVRITPHNSLGYGKSATTTGTPK